MYKRQIVFTADDAVEWAERGEKVILVRLETSPEDITGMKAAQGILTVRGGMTSHAAVVCLLYTSQAAEGCDILDGNIILEILFNKRECFLDIKITDASILFHACLLYTSRCV